MKTVVFNLHIIVSPIIQIKHSICQLQIRFIIIRHGVEQLKQSTFVSLVSRFEYLMANLLTLIFRFDNGVA